MQTRQWIEMQPDACLLMLATTKMTVNGAGSPSGVGTYNPYGEESVSIAGEYKFTNQMRDPNGVDHFWMRSYAPQLGRWLTPDPVGMAAVDPGNPQSWNRYAYVLNNPAALADPFGLLGTGSCMVGTTLIETSAGTTVCAPEVTGDNGFDPNYVDTGHNSGGGGDGIPLIWAKIPSRIIPPSCAAALQIAGQAQQAVTRAEDNWATLTQASAANGIDPRLLAAVGVRESGFLNVREEDGAGVGVGIFQITVSPASGGTSAQAGNLPWAADWAASQLNSDMVTLNFSFPNFNYSQLLQATAASYNSGLTNISGNPGTIDVGTAHNNYGSNVAQLMTCF